MNLTDLTTDETTALLALCAHLAAADGRIDPGELKELAELGRELGQGDLQDVLAHVKSRYPTEQDALELAKAVDREDAREMIRTVLMDLAQADGQRSRDERHLMSEVIAVWARD